MLERNAFFLHGEWVSAQGRDAIAVADPATEKQVAIVPAGTAGDVDVAAARAA